MAGRSHHPADEACCRGVAPASTLGYAYGYYLLAREPARYSGFIWIALAGKTLGPVGLVYSAATGTLPWSFGWVCVFNDLIWWPPFWRFALAHARR